MQVAHQIDRRIAVCSTQAHPPIWARTAPASTSLGGMVTSMVAVVPAIGTGGSVGTIEVFRSSFLCVPELTRRLLPEEWAGKGAARRGSAAALAARPRSLRVRRSGSPARRRAAPRKSLPDTALWPSRAATGAATISAAPTATTASPCGLPPVLPAALVLRDSRSPCRGCCWAVACRGPSRVAALWRGRSRSPERGIESEERDRSLPDAFGIVAADGCQCVCGQATARHVSCASPLHRPGTEPGLPARA